MVQHRTSTEQPPFVLRTPQLLCIESIYDSSSVWPPRKDGCDVCHRGAYAHVPKREHVIGVHTAKPEMGSAEEGETGK